jgi:hypothetical protein
MFGASGVQPISVHGTRPTGSRASSYDPDEPASHPHFIQVASIRPPQRVLNSTPSRTLPFNSTLYSLPPITAPQSFPRTSTSSSSITPSTTPRLSMNPFTATRSMRFVVALYSVRRTVSPGVPDPEETVEKERRTRGDSSSSTRRDFRAADARRAVGRGTEIVLRWG